MKTGLIKKCFAVLVTLTILVTCQPISTQALEAVEKAPTVEYQFTNAKLVDIVTPMSFRYIQRGESSLSRNGNTLYVSGSTEAYQTVAHIGVTLWLQWLSSSGWQDLDSEFISAYNNSQVWGGYSINVSSGYTYRIYAVHWVQDASFESGTTTTGSIYVP